MTDSVVTSFAVHGMTCTNCSESITRVLKAVPGVTKAEVSLMTETAVVTHSSLVLREQLQEAIEDCGFDAQFAKQVTGADLEPGDGEVLQVTLKVSGMTCTNCTNSVEQSLTSREGVKSCTVSLATEEAFVTYDSSQVGVRDLVAAVEDCGFDCALNSSLDLSSQLETLSKVRQVTYWRNNFIKCLLIGGPVVVFGHLIPSFMSSHHHQHAVGFKMFPGMYFSHFCEFLLTTYLQFFVGYNFYINSWNSLKHGNGTMDLLICISTTLAYVYSVLSMVYAAFWDKTHEAPDVLFPTTAMLFIFISLGKWLENKAKGHTSTALSKLLSLQPPTCCLCSNFDENLQDLQTQTIAVELLQVGDVLQISSGAKIPTDGVVIFGESAVDESLLTGESMPVFKSKGSSLIGGTVNGHSVMYMEVTHVGESTQLQQIVKLVKSAQMTKAPIQRYADSIASIFVPAILILALVTFTGWGVTLWLDYVENRAFPPYFQHDPLRKILNLSISVIVVACPCALGLAAPTAIMVGTGIGATHGILIKSGEFLEIANDIDYVLFDKTGTLTTGEFQITNLQIRDTAQLPVSKIWAIVGNVEKTSEHPIAKSLTKAAAQHTAQHMADDVMIKEITFESTMGVNATVVVDGETHRVRLGSDSMVQSVPDDVVSVNSSTCVYIEIDGKYVGCIELSDTVKPEAYETIKFLTSRNYSVAMCTGDNQISAQNTAQLLEIGQVYARMTPLQKSETIRDLQENEGRKVLFVGDGTNDAPALIQADLGIAISSGTDVAIESADVVLLDHRITNVVSTLDISIKTFHRIRLNFVWAMVYNVVMLPFAMGCFIVPMGVTLDPMLASASMAFSSVSVVVSSLMLKNWAEPLERRKHSARGGFWRRLFGPARTTPPADDAVELRQVV